jgi:DEAD/DEAH box helicase domain-containing protein
MDSASTAPAEAPAGTAVGTAPALAAGPRGPSGQRNDVAWLREQENYRDQIRAVSFYPPRSAATSDYPGAYGPLLDRLGIRPWQHQAEAFRHVEEGASVVIATATASGKSLCYQVPSLAALADGGTILYLAPTKALARDQLLKLQALAQKAEVHALLAAYDGDVPAAERQQLRQNAAGIVTNPDMLHHALLPWHAQWAHFLARLRFIVIDELHSYRGVLGAHVANILRRLLRIARHYGAQPQVLAASATINNPAGHLHDLTGLAAVAVTADGAPRGPRELIFWEPSPLPGNEELRRSPNSEAAALAALFVREGVRAIFFCNSRKGAELLRRYAADQLPGELAPLIQSYRAGYTPEDRRLIEDGFRAGDILVLTATSALELGIDVGAVDAVVLVGYPGSHMALWQRFGRAGRKERRSLALLIPGNDPLDEYYLRHPELISEGRVENATADPFNTMIHPLHLACAASELPLDPAESIIAPWCRLADVPGVHLRGGRWVHFGRYPHRHVNVRGTGPGRIKLFDGPGRLIGESDASAALRDVHPGAVYLHAGEAFVVAQLDLEGGKAVLLPHLEEYYTQARSDTEVEVLAVERSWVRRSVDRVRVTTSVTGFVLKKYLTGKVLDERLLGLPPVSYSTQALQLSLAHVARAVPAALLPGGIHALEHTLIGLLPAFVLCERADVGGVSYPAYGVDGQPVIFIYDGYPGGVGYVRAGAERFSEWLTAARDLLRDCACRNGCPRCILSPKCGNGNQHLDKAAALLLADALLAAPSTDALPLES